MTTNSKQRILVVDDDPDFAAYLRTVLEEDGFTVATACDGEDALACVRRSPPDLVTLDVQMPRKTGVLYYRQMKVDDSLRSIPVIVITGLRRLNDDAGPVVESFFHVERLPVPDAFLDKPVDKGGLLAAVREKLKAGPHAAPA